MLDNTDFIETDIPFDVPLPEEPFMKVLTVYDYRCIKGVIMGFIITTILGRQERGNKGMGISPVHGSTGIGKIHT